ncbi:MAG TPA: valine--tRNA ligase [Stellaceae bacterium]|nr:valine--tRNA ligase [Stellaceae bacterium]
MTLDKTYRPDEVEPRQYAAWERSGGFACDPTSAKRPYTIMMPPPNVTGSLHMGHALTFTLQDILVRFERMRGRDALWQPGTDHAGIATEIVVTNQLAEQQIDKHQLGRDKFIERVWEWKAESGGTIVNQLRRLGCSPDWPRERFTMDPGLAAAVRKVFVQLHREGLIYRDKRLVNWDPEMHTTISDLEVDSRETKGQLWHIRYPIEGEDGRYIVVATTRPETMLGDTGVAVHPEDARFAGVVGKQVRLPLVGRLIPIVADEYADPEMGSGAVKITPAHDFNDFEVGRRHGLKMINIFDADAKIKSSVFDDYSWGHKAKVGNLTHADDDGLVGKPTVEQIPEAYRGLDRFEVRKKVLADLEAAGLIEKVEDHTLMVPHHDRSGVVIEPWLTDQWYCNAKVLAKPAIEAVETGQTVFVPRQWENTFFEWMRNIQPWCISRQLWWGHQIPAWYAPDGTVFVAESEDEARAEAEAKFGAGVTLRRDEDVLDTWFSSALWPFSTLGWPEPTPEVARYYPGDVLVTGFDIIFFWVARMMMMGLHFKGEVPFRTVYIHALVRDERGQKMSKSRGNIIDPLDLIGRYGCDALRFTLSALAAPGRDIKLAESRVEGYRNFVTKLWNAARYAEMNGAVFDRAFDPRGCRETVNRWIASATRDCALATTQALEAYRFDEAANRLYQFAWGTFCDWYLEFSKPILQGGDAAAQAETRRTIGWVLAQIVHLLHPIMPYASEEVWAQLGGADAGLLLTAAWPDLAPDLHDPAAAAEMEWVIAAISGIRGVRSELNVPAAARLPLVIKDADAVALARLNANRDHIDRLARLEGWLEPETVPPGSVSVVVEGTTLILPLGEVIDFGQEKARLGKEIGRLDTDLAKFAAKLGNPGFLAKAKPEVIEEQREREADTRRDRDRLKAAYERLEAV